MAQELIVLVTCSPQEGKTIANSLVEENLAACVNIIPTVSSVFRWQGSISTENEALLIIKTNRRAWDALMKRIVELHSYECPEVIAVDIDSGYKPYLNWLNSSVDPPCLEKIFKRGT